MTLIRLLASTCLLVAAGGCRGPACSPGIPARELPDAFRMPMRAVAPELILSSLAQDVPRDYVLGPGDVLEVSVLGLFRRDEMQALRVQILGDGTIPLPLVNTVCVGGRTLLEAQQLVAARYADGFLPNPRVNLALVQRGVTDVVVLGCVNQPGAYPLPRFENDINHALAAAGGLRDDAADVIEVHRRDVPVVEPPAPQPAAIELQAGWSPLDAPPGSESAGFLDAPQPTSLPVGIDFILRIPLRGDLTPTVSTPDGGVRPVALTPADLVLQPGDVVRVPEQADEVFYVVGPARPASFARSSGGDEDRELGSGFLLPSNRDIDVVTAVAMAGGTDPISPASATVRRIRAGEAPLLILVDLAMAGHDPQENIYVEPGDVICVHPEPPWYVRCWRHLAGGAD